MDFDFASVRVIMDNNYTKTNFTVNGLQHSLEIDNRHTLLDVLRDNLRLTGAKKGCDLGECGSCTVLLDGKAVNSCQILVARIKNKDITTIEGLAQGEILHPLQISFIENDGGQCGYCTPGFIMAAYPLFELEEEVSIDEIKSSLAGNLCRCNAYGSIIDSVAYALEIKTDE